MHFHKQVLNKVAWAVVQVLQALRVTNLIF